MREVKEPPVSIGVWSTAHLGHFYSVHRTDLLRYATRLSGSPLKAEEFVQDALVKVLLAAPELESAEHGLAYFRKTIQSLVVDQLRREGRSPQLILLDDASDEIDVVSATTNEDLSQLLVSADDAVIVREALSLLSPAERTALLMWEVEGKSRAEIASLLGIRESSLRQTLSRARKSLRRILSERVIDEARGLTALDMLSHSYRKLEKVTNKGSRIALSLILMVAGFFGLSSLSVSDRQQEFLSGAVQDGESNKVSSSNLDTLTDSRSAKSESAKVTNSQETELAEAATPKSPVREFNNRAEVSNWVGLDAEGIPLGFTVSDASGNVGELFLSRKTPIVSETGLMASYLVGAKTGAVNILLDQSVITDAFGTSFVATVAIGIDGYWRPLTLAYIASEIERLPTGNYLLSSNLEVDEVLYGGVALPSPRGGRDLTSNPSYLAVKLVLDPTKTSILAQSVVVSANSQEGKA